MIGGFRSDMSITRMIDGNFWKRFRKCFVFQSRVSTKTLAKNILCRVQVYLHEETLQLAQVALTKIPRKKAKIYQETDFLSTEGHLLTSSGCFLALTSSLDVVQVRFQVRLSRFVCELSKLYSFANVEWFDLSTPNYDMAGS